MKIKYKNHSTIDQILPGNTRFETVRAEPGAIFEIDPEHLKMFSPADTAHLKPYAPEPRAPRLTTAPKDAPPDDETLDADALVKLLSAANGEG